MVSLSRQHKVVLYKLHAQFSFLFLVVEVVAVAILLVEETLELASSLTYEVLTCLTPHIMKNKQTNKQSLDQSAESWKSTL